MSCCDSQKLTSMTLLWHRVPHRDIILMSDIFLKLIDDDQTCCYQSFSGSSQEVLDLFQKNRYSNTRNVPTRITGQKTGRIWHIEYVVKKFIKYFRSIKFFLTVLHAELCTLLHCMLVYTYFSILLDTFLLQLYFIYISFLVCLPVTLLSKANHSFAQGDSAANSLLSRIMSGHCVDAFVDYE